MSRMQNRLRSIDHAVIDEGSADYVLAYFFVSFEQRRGDKSLQFFFLHVSYVNSHVFF